jgi:hypothetical protein
MLESVTPADHRQTTENVLQAHPELRPAYTDIVVHASVWEDEGGAFAALADEVKAVG